MSDYRLRTQTCTTNKSQIKAGPTPRALPADLLDKDPSWAPLTSLRNLLSEI